MGILSRTIFRETASSAVLGVVLFTFVLFLQRIGRLFELLVKSSAAPETLAYLFALILPPTLTFTVPVGVLVGVLIAMGRMSSDGEIIAMRATGVPSRRILYPVVTFALLSMVIAGAASLWLTPLATRESIRVVNKLLAEQLTAEIQPRVFEEQFPNKVLYVDDVVTGPVVQWRRIFIADLTAPDARTSRVKELGDAPRVTVASSAIAVPDVANNRIQLSTRDNRSYEVGKDIQDYYFTAAPKGDQALDARRPEERKAKPFSEMDTLPLFNEAKSSRDARIELHQRLTLPVACLIMALVAVPLGVSSRKSGKSSAFVLTVALAFLYWVGSIMAIGLAQQNRMSPGVAMWIPNAVFLGLALGLLTQLDAPGDRDVLGILQRWGIIAGRWLRGNLAPKRAPERTAAARFPLLPQIVDAYILSSFLYYFFVFVISLVLMTEVFTFFELLGDIIRNKIPMARVLTYLFFLSPRLIYDVTPISVLVAVLVTFGLLAKNNEITAFKASGVSLYRLSTPVLLASICLSVALFAFDYYIVPEANLKQDAIRAEIKGRPVQTYLRPDRKWIFGTGRWIYFYKYFDPGENVMVGVSVYDLNRETFVLKRHIAAERARWEPSLRRWVFQDGWAREMDGIKVVDFRDFTGQTATFPELDEPPNYFLKEVKQDQQMNFHQLDAYIRELSQGGYDTVKLQVQYHKKFSLPLFAFIMAIISTPFAFVAGNRGAMAGVGVSLGIAIAYWSLNQLFLQIGNLGQLPPELAAWAPDGVFFLAGFYFLMRMRT
jgi:LPS export ABC transporter permease LptG/LPS export ABC transporter permease LptF